MKSILIIFSLLPGCVQNIFIGDGDLHLVKHRSDEFNTAYMLGPVYYFGPGDTECGSAAYIPGFHANFPKNEFAVNKEVTDFAVRHWDGRGIFFYSVVLEHCRQALLKLSNGVLFPVSINSDYIAAAERSYKSPFDEENLRRRAEEFGSRHGGSWFSVSVNNDSCVPSGSPAERIEDIRRAGREVQFEDFGPSDNPNKVRVSYRDADFEYRRTYYRQQSLCESDLKLNSYIPDKYR